MPDFDIVKKSELASTFRIVSIMSMFDMSIQNVTERFTGSIPIEKSEWNIGVISGASGTGKTTIARYLWPDHYVEKYEYSDAAIVDAMPNSEVGEIARTFNSVGFASPPSWLKPYAVLSTGEQMRVDLARAILEKREMVVFDEFTSTINRDVAKIGSHAIAKAVRRMNRRFIAVTCHDDVIEWLEPDWHFNTDEMRFFFANCTDPTSKSPFTNTKDFGHYSGNIII